MNPEVTRAFLRAAVFLVLVSSVLIFATQRQSAEFVASVCSLAVGLTLFALVLVVNRLSQR